MKQPLIINSLKAQVHHSSIKSKNTWWELHLVHLKLCTHTHTTKIMAGNFFQREMFTLCPSHRWGSLWCPLSPVFTRPLSLQWSLRSSQTPKCAASVQVLIKAGCVATDLSVTRHPSWPLSSPSASPLQQWKRWRELRDYTRLSSDYKPASVTSSNP